MQSTLRMSGLLIALSLLIACAGDGRDEVHAAEPAPPAETGAPVPASAGAFDRGLRAHANLDFSCSVDSDCAIKDIGNCCGQYPACVNAGSPVDAAAVARECADSQMAGICGFPVINACVCSAGRCEAAGDGIDEAVE